MADKSDNTLLWLLAGAGIVLFKDDLLGFVQGKKSNTETSDKKVGGVLCPSCASKRGGDVCIWRDVCSDCNGPCAVVFDNREVVDAVMRNVFQPPSQQQAGGPQQPQQQELDMVDDVVNHPAPISLAEVEGTRAARWVPDDDTFIQERRKIQERRGYKPRNGVNELANIPNMPQPKHEEQRPTRREQEIDQGESLMRSAVQVEQPPKGAAMPAPSTRPAKESMEERFFLTGGNVPS